MFICSAAFAIATQHILHITLADESIVHNCSFIQLIEVNTDIFVVYNDYEVVNSNSHM